MIACLALHWQEQARWRHAIHTWDWASNKVSFEGADQSGPIQIFLHSRAEGEVYKYKLRRGNIMSPLPNEVLEIRPKIPGMRCLAAFWAFLEPTVANSRRALVAVARAMMAIDPKWYSAALDFLRQTRRWEQQTGEPSSSTTARVRPVATQPPKDPLTAPFA